MSSPQAVGATLRLPFIEKVLLVAFLGLFLIVWVKTAWVGDDAYITLRTVYNFLHGYGLTWNVDERVQAYTHPLWMLLLALTQSFSLEAYSSTHLLSALFSGAAVWLVAYGVARSNAGALFSLALLISSRAFVDYSSSGLENPLTHFLLAGFACVYLRSPLRSPLRSQLRSPLRSQEESLERVSRVFRLSLLTGLLLLNRMDTVLLVAPALSLTVWTFRSRRALVEVLLGVSPFLLWEIFSLFYYGFPFPNTAYAKLGTGIDSMSLAEQGVRYFVDSLLRDPVTLGAICLALLVSGVALFRRSGPPSASRPVVPSEASQPSTERSRLGDSSRQRFGRQVLPLALGVLFYLAYVVKIGGDFMAGRFFAAPLLLAVIMLSVVPLNLEGGRGLLLTLLALTFGFLGETPTLLSDGSFGRGDQETPRMGISNERSMYYPSTGLMRALQGNPIPQHAWLLDGAQLRREASSGERKPVIRFAVGMTGYAAGPDVILVDVYGLADPLLARLYSNQREGGWRIGHFSRWLPGGYLETLASGVNQLTQEDLASYYDVLSDVIRGPLWDWGRLRRIWGLNTGQYDAWLNAYRDPPRREIPWQALEREAPPARSRWDGRGMQLMSRRGVTVTLPALCHAKELELSLDRNDDYRLTFYRGSGVVGSLPILGYRAQQRGMETRTLEVPAHAAEEGYTGLEIVPEAGDGVYSLGHLKPIRCEGGDSSRSVSGP